VFIYSSHGKWVFPPSPVEFSSHHLYYKLSRSWLLGGCCHSCLLQPACLFTVPLTLTLRVPLPLCYVSFLLLLFIIQFGFFSVFSGGGRSVQGAMLSWPRVVCGSTMYCLAHLWSASPKLVRSWLLAPREPSWCLHLTWSVDALRWLGVWRCRSFTSSWWLFLQGVSTASLQDFTLGSMLSASSL
jgi:hypothetical protein